MRRRTPEPRSPPEPGQRRGLADVVGAIPIFEAINLLLKVTGIEDSEQDDVSGSRLVMVARKKSAKARVASLANRIFIGS